MFALTTSVALFIGSLFVPTAPAPALEDAKPKVPHCATMGANFQCDEERALSLSTVAIWEESFNLTYVTTRLDGVEPVVTDDMLALQDYEHPNMWHVFNLRYAPMLHV